MPKLDKSLASLYPGLAMQADGWDPENVSYGSNKKLRWKCLKIDNHRWTATPKQMTSSLSEGSSQTKCMVCNGDKILVGCNDLAHLHPKIAGEADGWDPTTVTANSNKKKNWICSLGHTWEATICNRVGRGSNCPVCSGRKVWAGFNDLSTLHPELAKESDEDPTTILAGTHSKIQWRCHLGHVWADSPHNRIGHGGGCPVCSNHRVLKGFNDLLTKNPDIAKEAHGWDPAKELPGSRSRRAWKCLDCGNTWSVKIQDRVFYGTGCPECAQSGYKRSKPAYLYLMRRTDQQQIGITNDIDRRTKYHQRFGWSLVEVVGPCSGELVLNAENELKKWLKKEVGLIKGTTENWHSSSLEVGSLAELKKVSGIITDLF